MQRRTAIESDAEQQNPSLKSIKLPEGCPKALGKRPSVLGND